MNKVKESIVKKDLVFWALINAVAFVLNWVIKDFWIATFLFAWIIMQREIADHDAKESLLFKKRLIMWDFLWLVTQDLSFVVENWRVSLFFFFFMIIMRFILLHGEEERMITKKEMMNLINQVHTLMGKIIIPVRKHIFSF